MNQCFFFYNFVSGFEVREVSDGTEVKWNRRQLDKGNDFAENGIVRAAERPQNQRTRSKTVHFVLPLYNRLTTFARFMDNYETVCLADGEESAAVTLTVVPFGRATAERAVAEAARLTARYPSARMTVVPDLVDKPFARAIALHAGADRAGGPPPDDLLFFVDVDMLWTGALVDRIRLNTVRGRTAYFPIVYSEYDPVVVFGRDTSPNHFLVNQDTGYWRQYGFGILSVYRSDLAAAGGYNTSIQGWGNEDVDLFEKFVRSRPVSVFRSADPDLVHVYHPVECDPGLPESKARMCADTRFETYGNVDQFANIIYKNRDRLYRFAAERANGTVVARVAAAIAPIR